MADKCLAKPSQSRPLATCDSRRLHEDSHLQFSNGKHFRFYWTKKHFISEWYFTKNHEIGSLVVRKVKTSWDSRQNRELGPPSLGSRRAIADLIGVMFIAWKSQKASKVHKRLSQSWPYLFWFETFKVHMKTIDSCEMYKNQHTAGRERSTTVVVLISGAFVWSRMIYERCLHLSDKSAYRIVRNSLFLTLRVIHKLKRHRCWVPRRSCKN